jgi:hypothetical protein
MKIQEARLRSYRHRLIAAAGLPATPQSGRTTPDLGVKRPVHEVIDHRSQRRKITVDRPDFPSVVQMSSNYPALVASSKLS